MTHLGVIAMEGSTFAKHAPPKRSLTLWQMLTWTYRDQKARRFLKYEADWFIQAAAEARLFDDMPRPLLHPDARIMHAKVCELGEADMRLIAYFAAMDSWPLPCAETPRPTPWLDVDRTRDNYGRTVIDGHLTDYKICYERITDFEPVWEVDANTNKPVLVRMEPFSAGEVEWCPLRWFPEPEFVAEQNRIAAQFEAAIYQLRANMIGIEFNTHEITDLDVPHLVG